MYVDQETFRADLIIGFVKPERAGHVVNHKISKCWQASIVKEVIADGETINHMLVNGWTILAIAPDKKGFIYVMGTSHKDLGFNVYDNKGRTI